MKDEGPGGARFPRVLFPSPPNRNRRFSHRVTGERGGPPASAARPGDSAGTGLARAVAPADGAADGGGEIGGGWCGWAMGVSLLDKHCAPAGTRMDDTMDAARLFAGEGEMRERCRAHDWA